jgi:hypothetical protein
VGTRAAGRADSIADYGIFAPGLTLSTFERIWVDTARIAGARLWYCWINQFSDVYFSNNGIGIWSMCNNMRITGSNFDGNSLTAVLIDGGNAIDIDSNCIEGNSGPAIIVASGVYGAPFSIAVRDNYYESNNDRPTWWRTPDGESVQLCTDLLINGAMMNESYTTRGPGPPWGAAHPVGTLGTDYAIVGVTVENNHASIPGGVPVSPTPCVNYAAVTAVSVTGLRIASNHMVPGGPGVSASLLRLGTDAAVWGASDVVFEANPEISRTYVPGTYGFSPLVELMDANRSISATGGELPYFSLFSPEVPQRNAFRLGAVARGGLPPGMAQLPPLRALTQWHNARETFAAEMSASPRPSAVGGPAAARTQGVVLATLELGDSTEWASQAVYIAFDAKYNTDRVQLALMIDPGDGRWQVSNASGLACNPTLGSFCGGSPYRRARPVARNATVFAMRSYQATLRSTGTARFGITLTVRGPAIGANVTLSGIAVARIGARWHSL